jgi:HTH-type transcriptional repressor of NAD biosynthesis genes
MYRGLVVGKFMPLHRGHQLLIESALARVDDLTVVVYDSKPDGTYPPMPIEKRLKWIAELYPDLENIVPREDILPSDMSQQEKDEPRWAEDYARDLDFLGKFDYVFSSEEYGDAFADALDAKNFVVDEARELVPISGTEIRENIYDHRGWLDPIVYRSLIQKVVFVGTESTGKSTLAKAMAEELNTMWVHEYGRELWQAQGLTGSFADMLKIAQNHYRREQAAMLHSRDFLFCDTNPWTTLQWNFMYNKTADARLFELVEKIKDEYIWFLCHDGDFDWVDDGTRELIGDKSGTFQWQIIEGLIELGVNFHTVWGTVEERVDQVKSWLTAGKVLARV